MSKRLNSVPRVVVRRPARFILRLVRLSVLVSALTLIVIALDAILLPDDKPGGS